MNKTYTPNRDELSGALCDATEDELLALAEFATWAEKHHMLLATGRRHGIRIGATSEVANFVRRSCLTPAVGESIAANLVPLQG